MSGEAKGVIDVEGLILAGAKPFDAVVWGRREATPEEIDAANAARVARDLREARELEDEEREAFIARQNVERWET